MNATQKKFALIASVVLAVALIIIGSWMYSNSSNSGTAIDTKSSNASGNKVIPGDGKDPVASVKDKRTEVNNSSTPGNLAAGNSGNNAKSPVLVTGNTPNSSNNTNPAPTTPAPAANPPATTPPVTISPTNPSSSPAPTTSNNSSNNNFIPPTGNTDNGSNGINSDDDDGDNDDDVEESDSESDKSEDNSITREPGSDITTNSDKGKETVDTEKSKTEEGTKSSEEKIENITEINEHKDDILLPTGTEISTTESVKKTSESKGLKKLKNVALAMNLKPKSNSPVINKVINLNVPDNLSIEIQLASPVNVNELTTELSSLSGVKNTKIKNNHNYKFTFDNYDRFLEAFMKLYKHFRNDKSFKFLHEDKSPFRSYEARNKNKFAAPASCKKLITKDGYVYASNLRNLFSELIENNCEINYEKFQRPKQH